MRNKYLLAIALTGAVAASAATARADEVVASQTVVWGQISHGLQLGLRFDIPNHIYRRGETARFDLIARNVGKKAVKIKYLTPLFPVPLVTDEKGKPVTGVLKSPPPPGYSVGLKTLALAPDSQTTIEKTEMRIGSPRVPTLFWALDAVPGQYRVSFKVQLNAPFEQKNKRAPIVLKSGWTLIGIAQN